MTKRRGPHHSSPPFCHTLYAVFKTPIFLVPSASLPAYPHLTRPLLPFCPGLRGLHLRRREKHRLPTEPGRVSQDEVPEDLDVRQKARCMLPEQGVKEGSRTGHEMTEERFREAGLKGARSGWAGRRVRARDNSEEGWFGQRW